MNPEQQMNFTQQANSEQQDFAIVSPSLTVEAMRDSGYKSTNHALAELIDNSIDAGASTVELIAVETPRDRAKKYARRQISELAVADNGHGMDEITLRRALKYGDGTGLDRTKKRIGRFGIGLPNASISQCKRVDIWTWQNGVDNALHCYLDLDDMKQGKMTDVPKPEHDPVPDHWRTVANSISASTGTLVVWSQLDRVRWRGGAKTLEKTEELCGRIYRKLLTDKTKPVQITLSLAIDNSTKDVDNKLGRGIDNKLELQGDPRLCQPNDPLYLISPSSTPEPFHNEPMFRLFNERHWDIPVDGRTGQISVRCTLAYPYAINEERIEESNISWPKSYAKAGDAPWGRHADRNKGISIVRARRELEISLAWINNYEPEERWWSVEVEFDPVLDNIFGVTNNKQHAHRFVEGAGFKWQELADPGENYGDLLERLREDQDDRAHLVEVWQWIEDQIKRMRSERKQIMRGTGTSRSRHPNTGEKVEDVATNIIREQAERGTLGDSDKAPDISPEDKLSQLVDSAKRKKVDEPTARKWAEEIMRTGRRVSIESTHFTHTNAFFEVESINDIIAVWLNDNHPVHEHLIEVVRDLTGDEDTDDLKRRLERASFTLQMMLIAWARYEDKLGSEQKEDLQDVRTDWGREARNALRSIEL